MARGTKLRETEIKLPLLSAAQGRRLLRRAGFRPHRQRVHEKNTVFDTASRTLRSRGELLRVRAAGRLCLLTFKGRPLRGKHRSRIEIEMAVGDPETARRLLVSLGFRPVFWYEKFRTEYRKTGSSGVATLDETPIGVFLELEGEPGWIDQAARALGFEEQHYITSSYGELYRALRRRFGGSAVRMQFKAPRSEPAMGGQEPAARLLRS